MCAKNVSQALYEALMLQNKCVTHINLLDDIPTLDEFGIKENILFIFDNFVTDAKSKENKNIEYFCTSGRHLNITSIYLTQSFTNTPIIIRHNTNVVVILNTMRGQRTIH